MREEIIGDCRLILGDCLDVLPGLEKGSVDAVVTDPPYGVDRNCSGIRAATWRKATEYEAVFPDTPEYIEKVVVPAVRLAIELSPVAITPGFKCLKLYPQPSHVGGFYYQGQSTVTAWGAAWWQPIFFYGHDPKTGMLQRDMFIGRSNREAERNGHPCPKEIKSWTYLVERMSFCGDTICDPFLGSGTTGVACVRTGRKFIGIEIEPKYFDIGCRRIEREVQLAKCNLFKEEKPVREVQRSLIADSA